jgi:hypothetical protein
MNKDALSHVSGCFPSRRCVIRTSLSAETSEQQGELHTLHKYDESCLTGNIRLVDNREDGDRRPWLGCCEKRAPAFT